MLSLMLVVIGDLARERLSFQPADLQTRKNEVSQDHCLPTSKQIWVTLKPSSVFHAHPSALAIFKNFSLWMATNPRPSCDGKKPEVSHDHKPFTGAPQHWRLHVRGLYSDDEVLTRQHEDVSKQKNMFSTSPKNAVTSGGYRMYVHVAIPYLSSRDT